MNEIKVSLINPEVNLRDIKALRRTNKFLSFGLIALAVYCYFKFDRLESKIKMLEEDAKGEI